VVVLIQLLLRISLAIKFGGVLGTKLRDFLLLKDVGKIAVASTAAGLLCLFVRSVLIANRTKPIIVLAVCSITFAAIYLPAILLLRVPTSDEREKVRGGVERLQQLVYPGRRSANSVP
jgi:hypothetical protein